MRAVTGIENGIIFENDDGSFDGGEGRGTNFHLEILDALSRRDPVAARTALEADIGRAFDLVMSDDSLWRTRGGAA